MAFRGRKMTINDFKTLNIDQFNSLPKEELVKYAAEGKQLLSKMVDYDPRIWEVMEAIDKVLRTK